MNDEDYMNIALQLANSVKGQTTPNPPVGAVIVKNDTIIGMGAHMKSGHAHAEVHALHMAGNEAFEATLYVTLEPCSYEGQTAPCVDEIIHHKIKRVVIGSVDRNEEVSGKGIEQLEKAGINVEPGILQDKTDELYEVFFHYITNKKPYITLKIAMTLDGKMATKTGESKWITSKAAREDVHLERHQHDAILVGVGTVISDNPRLTNRRTNGKNPIRIILDTNLQTPLQANVINDGQAPTWIFVSQSVSNSKISLYEAYEQVYIIRMNDNHIDLQKVLECLGNNEVTSVFVEGGATIHGSFFTAGYFNQFICYIAPKLIGGKSAKTPIEGEGISSIIDANHLEISDVKKIDTDIKIIAKKGD